jgi:hypothetical protein
MIVARLIVWLGVPIGLLAIVATYTLLNSWGAPGGICATWLGSIVPTCIPSAPPVRDNGRSI